jgi:tRNA dimethylallyltransferase
MRARGVVVLSGATASGKSDLAVELAQRFDGEIVGADSRQIYRDMPIGTAAPTAEQRAGVRHHMIDFLDPGKRYSAARYVEDAMHAIDDIFARGKRAIVVGGTGFYIRALSGAVELAPEYDEALRDRLAHEARLHPAEFLHEWLTQRDPRRAGSVSSGDTYRILRALEIALAANTTPMRQHPIRTFASAGIPTLKLFLDVDLAALDARIELRTSAMLRAGLVEEAERIGANAVAASAVGYPQALAFLAGWSTIDELRGSLERATRRYARRQRTWFRSEPNTQWVDRDRVFDAVQGFWGQS